MSLLKGQSIVEAQQFADSDILEELYERACRHEQALAQKRRSNSLAGKAGGLVFYEPSTRTRWSFEAAIRNLGGDYSQTENAESFSSAAKGERLEHSMRVMSAYVDFIILRHPHNNAATLARDYLQSLGRDTMIINAGCGTEQHPTQVLVDWFTIRKMLGRTTDLRIAFAGDNRRGRTARSGCYLLGRQKGVSIDLVSPIELAMEPDIIAYLERHNTPVRQWYGSLDEVITDADVLYMTRVQKERKITGVSLEHIELSNYRLTAARAQRMKKGSIILHPMPIVDEIESPVDRLGHAKYFEQSDNGVPVRMALLEMMLGV